MKFEYFFSRKGIVTTNEIINWWLRGWGFMNLTFLLYTLFHGSVLTIVFNNGWIFFLWPYIFLCGLVINLIFFSGLFAEFLLTKLLKKKINFEKIAADMKQAQLILILLIVASLSMLDFLMQ